MHVAFVIGSIFGAAVCIFDACKDCVVVFNATDRILSCTNYELTIQRVTEQLHLRKERKNVSEKKSEQKNTFCLNASRKKIYN